MNEKQKLAAGQSLMLLSAGDSLCHGGVTGWPYLTTKMLADENPNCKAEFISLVPGSAGQAEAIIQLQPGLPGYPTITMVRDGISGASSFRADNRASIFRFPCDRAFILLGTNDKYTADADYYNNMCALGLYGRQQVGAAITIITPAWYESAPTGKMAGLAWLAQRAAMVNGFDYVNPRRWCEDHFSNSGNGGLGDWLPFDDAHFGEVLAGKIAAGNMETMGY